MLVLLQCLVECTVRVKRVMRERRTTKTQQATVLQRWILRAIGVGLRLRGGLVCMTKRWIRLRRSRVEEMYYASTMFIGMVRERDYKVDRNE